MNYAIILAGGIGERMQSKLPKQFIEINQKSIIIYALEEFEKNNSIDNILVVVNKDYQNLLLTILKKYDLKKITAVINGGETRQASIYNGLKYLEDIKPENVVIHESVRPFISQRIINSMLENVIKYKAVSAGINVKSSIIEVDDSNIIARVPNKANLYLAQSQTFNYNLILAAHQKALAQGINNAHDDNILLMEVNNDVKIKIIQGDYNLFKITTPDDIIAAEDTLKRLNI